MKFKKAEVRVRKVPFPYSTIFGLPNTVIKLTDEDKTVYVMTDSFDHEVEKNLMIIADRNCH